ncbi:MAG: hypothetical protein AB1898_18500 [Acidobacteriota bacterium]
MSTFKKILIGFAIVFLLLIGYAIHAGVAVVSVKTPDARFWVPVPIVFGHWIGTFVNLPMKQQPEFEQFLEYREAAVEILRQLKELPDSDLVEVEKSDEHIRIFKRGDYLYVSVDQPREQVRVRLPLRAAERMLHSLMQENVNVGDLIACLEWEPAGELVHVKTQDEEIRVSLW